jgi:hypothetical protein
MAEKKSDFVVTDRRRFGAEGELRSDVPINEEEKTEAAAPPVAKATPPPTAVPQQQATPQAPATGDEAGAPGAPAPQSEEMPAPPTAEEQHEQSEAYKLSGKKIDEMIAAAGNVGQGPLEINFERVIESFYMSALIQMGAIRSGNEPPQVDVIGARQTIDSLTILQEKTKGNLSDREKTLMQNVLFELRMAWIELTNAVAASATKPGVVPPMPPSPLEQK